MTDLGSFIAVGLSGFLTGMAYSNRDHLTAQRAAARAGALVVDECAYLVAPFRSLEPGPTPRPSAVLFPIEGGNAGDVA